MSNTALGAEGTKKTLFLLVIHMKNSTMRN